MDSISIESFVKTSEADQELVYEMYQAKIQGNDWVRYGLAPMILLNCSLLIWGMINLERYTYKRYNVKPKP
jgi:hypothetical protein